MLGCYVFFSLKKKSILCFLQTYMARDLSLHTVAIMLGWHTETKPRGVLPQTHERGQFIDEYIQTLAGEAFSPIQLPKSKLCAKTRSAVQKPMQWSTAEYLYSCLGDIFSCPVSHSQHEILDSLSPDVHTSALCSNHVLFSI